MKSYGELTLIFFFDYAAKAYILKRNHEYYILQYILQRDHEKSPKMWVSCPRSHTSHFWWPDTGVDKDGSRRMRLII